MKIVFFGTPRFAADTLAYLLQHGVNVVAVVTRPDKPKGRSGSPVPTPVKEVALAHQPSIPVFQPVKASAPDFADTLKNLEADLFVVVAYGEIIKDHVLAMPRLGCINVHGSLLPKYRGAAPIQRAIMQGEKETGITIMYMVREMDAGDIIKTVALPINDSVTAGELQQSLCQAGSVALFDVIRQLEKGPVMRHAQDHSQVTFAPKIELDQCQIDWHLPAQQLHDLIRGVHPEPGAWCIVQVRGKNKRLRIHRSQRVAGLQGTPGQVLAQDKLGILVASGQDALRLLEVQLEGKKAMLAAELARGYPIGTLVFTVS